MNNPRSIRGVRYCPYPGCERLPFVPWGTEARVKFYPGDPARSNYSEHCFDDAGEADKAARRHVDADRGATAIVCNAFGDKLYVLCHEPPINRGYEAVRHDAAQRFAESRRAARGLGLPNIGD